MTLEQTPLPADTAAQLCTLVAALIHESSPQRQAEVTLDAQLERDLAIDSLTRVELLLLLLAATPRGQASWTLCRAFLRFVLAATRVRVQTAGFEQIAAGPLVLVANHASFLDGPILLAMLPRPVAFVAKRELKSSWLMRFVLDRLGVRYVERFEQRASVADAQQLAAEARAGTPLLFFAEGTFRREPGLLPFHLGAFAAATQAQAPLIPVALAGTRALLPDRAWLPRPARIRITAGEPLLPAGEGWDAAVDLRDRARGFIAAHCGEPERIDVPR